jgi:hypothetical protein
LGKQVVIEKPHYSHQYPIIAEKPGWHPQPSITGEVSSIPR